MPRKFTGRCFSQPASSQPWVVPELERWAASGNDEYEAMGANIECDHRVPLVRFEQLGGMPLGPTHAGRLLQTRVESYKAKYNFNTNTPAFLAPANDGNIYRKMSGAIPLVSVFQINKYAIPALLRMSPFSLFGSSPREFLPFSQELKRLFPDDVAFGLADSLGAPAIEFLDKFFQQQFLIDGNRRHGVWVGRWQEFETLAETNAATWMSAMGVRIPAEPSLCLLLRYDAYEVHPLVRPTMLEAGWYPEHFPSPETTSWCTGKTCSPTGGHPMGLDEATILPLRAEYVHRDRKRKSSWVYAWAWVQPTPAPPIPLASARRRHWDLLKGHYDKVEDWLLEP